MELLPCCSFHKRVETLICSRLQVDSMSSWLTNVKSFFFFSHNPVFGGEVSTPSLKSSFDIQLDISGERQLPSLVKVSVAVLSAGGREP